MNFKKVLEIIIFYYKCNSCSTYPIICKMYYCDICSKYFCEDCKEKINNHEHEIKILY